MLNGKTIELNAASNNTIFEVKQKIHIQHNISINKQVLVFIGQTLNDDKTFKDYNIKNGSQIHLIVRYDCSTKLYVN